MPVPKLTVARTEPSESLLTDRPPVDYRNHRERYVQWLLTFGGGGSRSGRIVCLCKDGTTILTKTNQRWFRLEWGPPPASDKGILAARITPGTPDTCWPIRGDPISSAYPA